MPTQKKKVVAKKKPAATHKAQAKSAPKPAPKGAHKPKAAAPAAKSTPQAKSAPPVKPAQNANPPVSKPAAPRPAAMKPAAPKSVAPIVTAPSHSTPRPVAATPVAARPAAASAAPKRLAFKINELIVYPAHGVGKVVQIEEQEIAGTKLELYIVDFEKEKLRLKVPTSRAEQKGMRKLADRGLLEQAMMVLKGRARIKRTMWSRRAQEYEAKINSGDLISVAEVVRDLYRSERQPEQSYSERQLYEQALERMARELAAIKKIDDEAASKEIEEFLGKHAKRTPDKNEPELPAEQAA